MKNNIFWKIIWLTRKNIVVRNIVDQLAVWYYKLFRSSERFKFNGIELKYFHHIYNCTIANERAVEVSLAESLVNKYKNKQILEVGNILNNYFPVSSDIVDKYEKNNGVINCDINKFFPHHLYDLIISVSTLEHIGMDYGEKTEEKKALTSIRYLKRLLNKGGQIFITIPLGWNKALYNRIIKSPGLFDNEYYFKKISPLNDWIQVGRTEALKSTPFDKRSGNTLLVYVGTETKR